MAGKTLADAIAFDIANAATEMPYFFQEIFELAEALAPGPGDAQPLFGGMTYNDALAIDHNGWCKRYRLSAQHVQSRRGSAPTDSPGWTTDLILSDHFIFASSGLAGGPGYPIVQVPSGSALGMPVGISFFGTLSASRR